MSRPDSRIAGWITFVDGRPVDYSYLTPWRVLKAAQTSLGVTADGIVGPATLRALVSTLERSAQSGSEASKTAYLRFIGRPQGESDFRPGRVIPLDVWTWLVRIGIDSLYPGEEVARVRISSRIRPILKDSRPRTGSRAASGSPSPSFPVARAQIHRPTYGMLSLVPSGQVPEQELALSEQEAASSDTKGFVVDTTRPAELSVPVPDASTLSPEAIRQMPEMPPTPSFLQQHMNKILIAAVVAAGVGVAYAVYKKE